VSGGTLASVAAAANVTGTITMGKSFLLQQVVSTFKVRVRLYSTAAARDADVTRPFTVPIGYGTQPGIIAEMYLITSDKLTLMRSRLAASPMHVSWRAPTWFWLRSRTLRVAPRFTQAPSRVAAPTHLQEPRS